MVNFPWFPVDFPQQTNPLDIGILGAGRLVLGQAADIKVPLAVTVICELNIGFLTINTRYNV